MLLAENTVATPENERSAAVEGQYLRRGKRRQDATEHPIAALDIGRRLGLSEIGIAAKDLLMEADNAERQIGTPYLSDASHQRGVFRACLLLQDTDVIGIQQKLHDG
jgi:hypothetical protein